MGRGFGITAAVGHDVVRELAREAESLGYSSFWSNDIPQADGLASLAAASLTTSRIKLGVGVIPLDQRSAYVIEQEVRVLRLRHDRLVLGLGSGGSHGALDRVRAGLSELSDGVSDTVVVGAL